MDQTTEMYPISRFMWLWRLKIRPTTQSYQKVGATCGRPFGMLLNGVTLDKIREGYSKVRNRAIVSQS